MANVWFLAPCMYMYINIHYSTCFIINVRMNSPLGNKSFFEMRGDEMPQLVREDSYSDLFYFFFKL